SPTTSPSRASWGTELGNPCITAPLPAAGHPAGPLRGEHGVLPRHVRPGVPLRGLRRLVPGAARAPVAAVHLLDLHPALRPVLEPLTPPPAPGPAAGGLRGGHHPGDLARHAQPAHYVRSAHPAGAFCPAVDPPGQGAAER